MNQPTLKQLRYFDAVARHLHFGRAADACCVTQPALSMQILELERTLETTLIERARGGIRLTGAGDLIARRAARILSDTDDLVTACGVARGVLAQPLRLGFIPTAAPYLLPALLAHLKRDYPDLKIHVRETQTRQLIDELLDGKLDCIVLALPIEGDGDLATLPLFEDRFLLAAPVGAPLSGKVRATREMVASERLFLLEEGHCLRDQALAYCELKHAGAIDALGLSTLSTVAGMVEAGHGITLLPEICLDVETRGRAIAVAPFVAPEPARTLGLAWRATSPRAADFNELARLLKTCQPLPRDRAAWGGANPRTKRKMP